VPYRARGSHAAGELGAHTRTHTHTLSAPAAHSLPTHCHCPLTAQAGRLEAQRAVLVTNISVLFKTAQLEIARKDAAVRALRSELEAAIKAAASARLQGSGGGRGVDAGQAAAAPFVSHSGGRGGASSSSGGQHHHPAARSTAAVQHSGRPDGPHDSHAGGSRGGGSSEGGHRERPPLAPLEPRRASAAGGVPVPGPPHHQQPEARCGAGQRQGQEQHQGKRPRGGEVGSGSGGGSDRENRRPTADGQHGNRDGGGSGASGVKRARVDGERTLLRPPHGHASSGVGGGMVVTRH
jgi:hypothetical protein